MMAATFSSPRPRPLRAAADRVAKVTGTLTALVTALAGAGIALVTAEQADALTAILGAVPGVVALVGTALAAFGVVKQAEPLVTPVESPMDNQGNHLVPGDRRVV